MMSASELKEWIAPVMTKMGRSNGDGPPSEGWVPTSDNTGPSVVCYIDHDFIDYALVEVRRPFRNPKGPTIVDFLYIHRHPDGVDLEWRNKPRELFDRDTEDFFAPYQDFHIWAERQAAEWVGW